MAGQGKKTFSDGEVLSAADVNGYLMDQSVMRFADSAARTAAIGTPTEGMVTYLDDVNQIEVYDGAAWVDQQAPILSEGTAGQYLQSNGTAGSQWVDLEIADDIITTQGDLIVGDSGGTAVRLPIGAVDTVLTSDGTAVSWAAGGGGGGGELFYLIPAESFIKIEETLSSGLTYEFGFPDGTMDVYLLDSGGNIEESFTGNTTVTLTTDIEEILIKNDNGDSRYFKRSNPVVEDFTADVDVIQITSTQSVTLTKTYDAILIGGGGAGGGTSDTLGPNGGGSGGGGGGSGYLTIGTVTPGTYTATVGAGAPETATGSFNGTDGGTTSIAGLTAAGGQGGTSGAQTVAGDGGDGGSGGGGGGSRTSDSSTQNAPGGINGNDGEDGEGTNPGVGGSGSGFDPNPNLLLTIFENSNFYRGGDGGGPSFFNGSNGPDGDIGQGGGGAKGWTDNSGSYYGGAGGSGQILLVEQV